MRRCQQFESSEVNAIRCGCWETLYDHTDMCMCVSVHTHPTATPSSTPTAGAGPSRAICHLRGWRGLDCLSHRKQVQHGRRGQRLRVAGGDAATISSTRMPFPLASTPAQAATQTDACAPKLARPSRRLKPGHASCWLPTHLCNAQDRCNPHPPLSRGSPYGFQIRFEYAFTYDLNTINTSQSTSRYDHSIQITSPTTSKVRGASPKPWHHG